MDLRVGDLEGEPELRLRGDRPVLRGDQDDGGHVDVADPAARRERGDGVAGLEHHAHVVAAELLAAAQRRSDSGRLPRRQRACGNRDRRVGTWAMIWPVRVVPAAAAIIPTNTIRCCSPGMNESLVAPSTRPGHLVGVAAPQQLRHRAAHRVADRDGRLDAELVEQRGAVVGAVGEPEAPPRRDAAAVAAQVGGDDPEVRG